MPRRRAALVILLGLSPWPAVYLGIDILHSAWAGFALYHGVCAAGWLIARAPLPPKPEAVWRRTHWIGLAAVCLAINLAVSLAAGGFAALLAPDHARAALLQLHAGDTASARAALFVYFAAVNPIAEELFWRGAIYGGLREARWPLRRCAAVSGLLFGAWHWLPVHWLLPEPLALVAVAGIVAAGIALGLFYDRTRSLPATMLLHGLGADVPLLVMLWVDVLGRRLA